MLHAGAATHYEEDLKANSSTDQRVYLVGPAGPVGVLETTIAANGNKTISERYSHRDHLGSTTVISDETGGVVNRYRYDPWGKPLAGDLTSSAAGTGNRGFTGHEHLTGGLIHMNGRIYDPVLGRFLSADIVVQSPENVQSYNRYSYVLNNPLGYTDSSGYFLDLPLYVIAALFATTAGAIAYAAGFKDIGRMLFGIALALLLGPNAALGNVGIFGAGNAFASTVAAGFAAGGASSGNLRGALSGALSAGLFYGVGEFANEMMGQVGRDAAAASGLGPTHAAAEVASNAAQNSVWAHGGVGRAGLHALVGCAMALTSKGKCGAGALSAGFGELAGPFVPKDFAQALVVKTIVGGIASELGGGKFANGAMSAAFGHLFNCGATSGGNCGDPNSKSEISGQAVSAPKTLEESFVWFGKAGLVAGGAIALPVAGSAAFNSLAVGTPFLAGDTLVTVTTWAGRGIIPELNAGRWVMLGNATSTNFTLTGLSGGYINFSLSAPFWQSANATVSNYVTWTVTNARLAWPSGFEAWKGLLGQRVLKGPGG